MKKLNFIIKSNDKCLGCNINMPIFLMLFPLFLASCGQDMMVRLITKTPNIEYKTANGFNSFSKYHKDAIYTVATVKDAYPRLYQKVPYFDVKAENFIKKAAQTVSDKDFEILVYKFISGLNDGHSSFYVDYPKFDKTRYGLQLYKEKENWIITNVDKDIDSTVIGKKIVSINNIPIKEFEKRIIGCENGENEFFKYAQFLRNITFPSYWQALDVTTTENKDLNFVVENEQGISKFTLKEKEKDKRKYYAVKYLAPKYKFRPKQNNGFFDTISKSQNFAYLQMNTSLDYVSIKSEIDNYTNFFTKPIALGVMKKEKKDARDFGKFLQSFFKRVHEQKIENLIIDLSNNGGGDERTGKQLLWYLTETNPNGFTDYLNNSNYFKSQIKVDYKKYNALYKKKYQTEMPKGEVNLTEKLFNEPYFNDITKNNSPFLLDNTIPKFKGKVYVIIGTQTFSAGQVLATTIADNHLGTLIGKPNGNKPTTQTGASAFKLPNTKKIITISYTYMERPDKTKNDERAVFPDVETFNTFQDFLTGDDKAMEHILGEIKKK